MTLQHFFYSFTKQTGNLWKSFWKLKKYIFVLIFPKTFPKIFNIPKLQGVSWQNDIFEMGVKGTNII